MSKSKDLKLVMIHWIDSNERFGWEGVESAKAPGNLKCESVGWIINDHADYKVIAPHRTAVANKESGSVCSPITIPTRAITKIRKLQ